MKYDIQSQNSELISPFVKDRRVTTLLSYANQGSPSYSFRSNFRSFEGDRPAQSKFTELSQPLTPEEWLQIVEGKKNIFENFGPWRIFNSLFHDQGIEDSIRGKIWCKLFEVD